MFIIESNLAYQVYIRGVIQQSRTYVLVSETEHQRNLCPLSLGMSSPGYEIQSLFTSY